MLAYFGHHKCGSHWLTCIVRQVCQEINRSCAVVHTPESFDYDLPSFVRQQGSSFLVYTNANIRYVSCLRDYRGFHVVRDPRDIIVSAYFSHLHTHRIEGWPALSSHREQLRKASLREGLFLEMDFSQWLMADLFTWNYDQPQVLELHMEDVIGQPYERLVGVFEHLGLVGKEHGVRIHAKSLLLAIQRSFVKRFGEHRWFRLRRSELSLAELLSIIYVNRFETHTKGRSVGQEDRMHHYRKGVAGDWVNYFGDDHCEYFKQHYNPVLLKLGYEKTPDWQIPATAIKSPSS